MTPWRFQVEETNDILGDLTGFLWSWNKGKVIASIHEGISGDKYCVK